MAPHIPFEIITGILEKLPVKSLLKFRVVCKSWCSLISSKQFVRKHLSSNTCTPKSIIQLSHDFITFYSLHDTELVQVSSPIKFRIENPNYHCKNNEAVSSFLMMGYCDGLVFVEAYTNNMSHLFIWNPNTRDSELLPYPPGVVTITNRTRKFDFCGFGYDYNSDDYKVIVVAPPDYYRYSSCISLVYTLRTTSWRRIQDFPLDTRCGVADRCATLVKGALHWMVRQGLIKSWVIVSLDLTTETYMEVPQPNFCGIHVEHIGIGASRTGCLCLHVYNKTGPKSYNFWVMKEYGVQESWSISIKIPCMVDGVRVFNIRPVTWFPENGKILFQTDGKLAIYNENVNSLRYLPGGAYYISYSHGDVYVESLVSPNAYSNRGAKGISLLNINVG